MTIWKNCVADLYYSNGLPKLHDSGYEVRITGDDLVISYQSDSGWIVYRGKDHGGGHYDVSCPQVKGRAMLHRLADSEFLEGNWSEDSAYGMWHITLHE